MQMTRRMNQMRSLRPHGRGRLPLRVLNWMIVVFVSVFIWRMRFLRHSIEMRAILRSWIHACLFSPMFSYSLRLEKALFLWHTEQCDSYILSIKGKITERWLVEREGIFFLIEGIFSNQERAWLPVNDWLIRCIATVRYLEILIFLRINFALYW